MNKTVEEVLYPAMEEGVIDIIIGKGPSARSVRLDLPKFTMIGATTKAGSLSSPLRDRFGIIHQLEFYDQSDIESIVKRSARILGADIDKEGAIELAKRSRRTPRIANRLLKRTRDYAEVKHEGSIDKDITRDALKMFEIDELGLDKTDRRILEAIIYKFSGGPVGLDIVCASTSEDSETLEDVYEPYLLQIGFIDRTPRGRKTTHLAYKHITGNDQGSSL